MPGTMTGKVLLKTGDNISTDHISPAGAKVLPLRSNIPAISEFTFTRVDKDFPARAKEWNGGFIIGGDNYGQGSSREHAALSPRFLGVKAVIVKQFNRIHRSNLINFGIVPLTFADPNDYDSISLGDELELSDVRNQLQKSTSQNGTLQLKNKSTNKTITVSYDLTVRQKTILCKGGLLNVVRNGK